jgi:hypothetical protein
VNRSRLARLLRLEAARNGHLPAPELDAAAYMPDLPPELEARVDALLAAGGVPDLYAEFIAAVGTLPPGMTFEEFRQQHADKAGGAGER